MRFILRFHSIPSSVLQQCLDCRSACICWSSSTAGVACLLIDSYITKDPSTTTIHHLILQGNDDNDHHRKQLRPGSFATIHGARRRVGERGTLGPRVGKTAAQGKLACRFPVTSVPNPTHFSRFPSLSPEAP